MCTSHLNIILSTSFLSLGFFPKYSNNSFFVPNFIPLVYKLKRGLNTTILYSFLSQLQAVIVAFLYRFVFLCRAPVSILFKFNANRMGWYPSSLSRQGNYRQTNKSNDKQASENFYGRGLLDFGAFFFSFFG